MDFVRAVILGIIQAITEFLPVSSSAHLILFRDWLGFESTDGLMFDVALHVGTVAAVIIYFRRDLGRLVAGAFESVRSRDFSTIERRMPWFIAAGTVPAAIAGVADFPGGGNPPPIPAFRIEWITIPARSNDLQIAFI